jgi:tryptophan-rich sensory protein
MNDFVIFYEQEIDMSVTNKTREAVEWITGNQQPRWRWYHGIAFYVIVQTLTFGLSGLTNAVIGKKSETMRDAIFGDVSYFRSLKQSVITPPSWAFGPAWTLSNILTIYGNLRVLNMPKNTVGRDAYLALQTASWIDYVLFSAAYFSLRSPINAFFLTLTMFLLTIASILVSIFQLKDTKVALSFATLIVWLTVALTAAAFQAAWNRDELYKVGPFAKVNPALAKEAK